MRLSKASTSPTRLSQLCSLKVLLPFAVGYLVAYVSVYQDTLASDSILQTGSNTDSHDKADDGWRTIQVFAGPSEDFQGAAQFHGQARQDELILALLHNKTDGYFIDLAANDAHYLSNTAALEHYYQWTGLCIEPNPLYWYNLTLQRPNCQIVAAVVGRTRDEPVFFRFESNELGGIAADGFDNGAAVQASSQRTFTVPFLEILERNKVPKVIDYLSLDVEGAEGYIIMNFPLDQYKIKIITAERLKEDAMEHLKQRGFEYMKELSTWGESLWVHTDYKSELDMSAVDKFAFPLSWPR